jgi:hypothetical protein
VLFCQSYPHQSFWCDSKEEEEEEDEKEAATNSSNPKAEFSIKGSSVNQPDFNSNLSL